MAAPPCCKQLEHDDFQCMVEYTKAERPFLTRAFGAMGTGSLRGCTVSLIFSAVGAGILSLPWAIARLGLVVGIGALLASAVFSYATMEMLIVSGLDRKKLDYAGTLSDILGPRGADLVNLVVIIDSAGAICVFYVYMADSIRAVAVAFGYDFQASLIIVAMSFGTVLPLSLPEQITALQRFAVASLVPLIFVISLVVLRCPFLTSWAKLNRVLVRADLMSIEAAQACSAIFFSYMCHMNVWSVRNELHRPTERRTSKVFRRAVGVLFLLYTLFGIAGSLSFADATPSDILQAYPASDRTNLCAHLLMALMLIVCSVLCVHPVRNSLACLFGLQGTILSKQSLSVPHSPLRSYISSPKLSSADMADMDCSLGPECSEEARTPSSDLACALLPDAGEELISSACSRYTLTLAIISVTCTVAIAVPSVVQLLGILGGFCGVVLMFVLPTFIYAQTRTGVRSLVAIALASIFSVVGLVAAVGSVMPASKTP